MSARRSAIRAHELVANSQWGFAKWPSRESYRCIYEWSGNDWRSTYVKTLDKLVWFQLLHHNNLGTSSIQYIASTRECFSSTWLTIILSSLLRLASWLQLARIDSEHYPFEVRQAAWLAIDAGKSIVSFHCTNGNCKTLTKHPLGGEHIRGAHASSSALFHAFCRHAD